MLAHITFSEIPVLAFIGVVAVMATFMYLTHKILKKFDD